MRVELVPWGISHAVDVLGGRPACGADATTLEWFAAAWDRDVWALPCPRCERVVERSIR